MTSGLLDRLVLFGATGDLARRFLLPALAHLWVDGRLPPGIEILGAARDDLGDDAFRRLAADALDRHASDAPADVRAELVARLRYRPVDLSNRDSVAAVIGQDARPLVAYLALPPSTYPAAVTSLGAAGLPTGSRVVFEKPFGEDLTSAIALNELVAQVGGEEGVFRVDHVLGMATVHNLIGARLANRILDPLWNSTHIERVDILWDETLALEGRAGYYDRAGALEDVMQNHLLQILALVAMEPPAELTAAELRARKVDVLRAVRIPTSDDVTRRSTRARYSAGHLAPPPEGAGTAVPAYVDEDGVDPARGTETFAEVLLEIDTPRWAGTPFLLRAGKALDRRRKGVILRFRPVDPLPFGPASAPPPNELRIGLDGPLSFTLSLTGSAPGRPARLMPLVLDAPLPADQLPAYSHVLLHVLEGDTTLSVSGEEAELAWRIVTPIIDAWRDRLVPLQTYPAGTDGPPLRFRDQGVTPE